VRNHLAPAALVAAVFAAPVLWAGCGGGSDPAPVSCTPVTESCDGVDDDCDGETDEAGATGCTAFFEDADADGSGGASACLCAAAGSFTLTEGGDCDDSDASIHPGAAEVCDGLDDDCDAQTDEGIAGCCAASATQPCGVAQGRCEVGTSTCGATFAWGPCLDAGGAPVVLPGDVAEACDGLDDDCDGQTDEGFGLGGSCNSGTGACAVAGQTVCKPDGSAAICDATPGTPGTEICNGLDDDCDGQTDEDTADVGAACDGGDADLCNEGTTACETGGLVCGDHTADSVELCNGFDDDCDGQTDEAVTDAWLEQACCGTGNVADCTNTGTGTRCRTGAQVCSGGGAVCVGAVAKAAETCNGVDDDCNGAVDDIAGAGTACTAGGVNTTGACTAAYTCNGAPGPGPYGLTCSQIVGPMSETCNGLDDDCDGTTDEALPPLCPNQLGVCAGSSQTCGGASGWRACTAASYGASYEVAESVCDSLDNDCDGQVDEPFKAGGTVTLTDLDGTTGHFLNGPCGAGRCAGGLVVCSGSRTSLACTTHANAVSEACANSLDDDCDGQTDEPGCL
jgi:putative metal-binding protein